MSSSRGPPFTTSNPSLAPWTRDLNSALAILLGSLHTEFLEIRWDARTGLGTYVRPSCVVDRGQIVAAYWGQLSLDPPRTSRYVLELPPAVLDGRTVVPYIDAHLVCLRSPPQPANAAWLNHCCHEPTCYISSHWVRHSDLPLAVVKSNRRLPGGTQLTFNYDAVSRTADSTFTISRQEADLWPARGARPTPCGCNNLGPCPRDRWFPPQ